MNLGGIVVMNGRCLLRNVLIWCVLVTLPCVLVLYHGARYVLEVPTPGSWKAFFWSFLSTQEDRIARIETMFDIRVVNLKRHPERLQRIFWQAKAMGIILKREDAVDGRKLNLRFVAERGFFSPDFMQDANRAELGCVWSHVRLWERFLYDPKQKPYLLVLEDDVNLKSNLDVALYHLGAKLTHPPKADVILLGWMEHIRPLCAKKAHTIKEKICKYQEFRPEKTTSWDPFESFVPVDYSGGAHAYIVPRSKVLQLLKAYRTPIKALVDREWWNPKHRLVMRALVPKWYGIRDCASSYGQSATADASISRGAPSGSSWT